MSDYESVLETRDLGPGQSREVEVRGDRVLLLNIGQIYYAVEARCPESGAALEVRTRRQRDRLICPDDAAEYDLASGERLDGSGRPLHRYAVRVEGNVIKVGPPLVDG
ncbi:MAG TPA: nitrite reductase (NAD(P)H) small subunit [Longimicrobiales bacterium]|nr:nitrite reductase (NAD(P)H) small subunit [Longimicrobiales bacterium]